MQTVTINGRNWPLPALLEHYADNRAIVAEQLAAARAANDQVLVAGIVALLELIDRDLAALVASAGPAGEA
jgi:hypothetical protein